MVLGHGDGEGRQAGLKLTVADADLDCRPEADVDLRRVAAEGAGGGVEAGPIGQSVDAEGQAVAVVVAGGGGEASVPPSGSLTSGAKP
jgi:hypothetical protein